MSLDPLHLVAAHSWKHVAFTTYSLSLSFFEAVILDRLVRGNSSPAVILADVAGVRASLGELGAQRVGKEYGVEPVKVPNGVFHPKVSIFCSREECHLLVGSGNLTFGGWGGNCEVVEHLHPSFAPDAIGDAATFFERVAQNGRVRHAAAAECLAIADELRLAARGRPSSGGIRLLHSLDSSISEQLVQLSTDLGGARQLVAVAPFWDDGAAIDGLCTSLDLDRVFIHAHPGGAVRGRGGSNWPRAAQVSVTPVRLEPFGDESRSLHAKAFEIVCRGGRIVMSGSANGSDAALGRGHNVEACVVRVEREQSVGWRFSLDAAVPSFLPSEEGDEDEQRIGVLRALLERDMLTGMVLVPRMAGPVVLHILDAVNPHELGTADILPDRTFQIRAPGLEVRSWRGGRLILRATDSVGQQAEGFVSLEGFHDITRRAGPVARQLFSILAGTETPEDVAAIMAWFSEEPNRLFDAASTATGGGGEGPATDAEDELIAVAALSIHYAEAAGALTAPGGTRVSGWQRFMEQLLSALREPRGPAIRASAADGSDDENEDYDEQVEPTASDLLAIDRSLKAFEKLFDALTKAGAPTRSVLVAFDLAQYVCDRLRVEAARARRWLERLLQACVAASVPSERRDAVAAAALALLGADFQREGRRRARDCLLRLGIPLDGPPPSSALATGFLSVLPQHAPMAELWRSLSSIRTFPEQVRSVRRAFRRGRPSAGYPDLPAVAPDEWPVICEAIESPAAHRKIVVARTGAEACPRCNLKLPHGEVQKLRTTGIATARNCCGRVILWSDVT